MKITVKSVIFSTFLICAIVIFGTKYAVMKIDLEVCNSKLNELQVKYEYAQDVFYGDLK